MQANDGLPNREPFEVSLLLFGVIVGSATLITLIPAPPAIQAQTRVFGDLVWVSALVLGAAVALAGIFWPRKLGVVKITPLLLEQVGLVLVAGATFVYAVSLVVTNGFDRSVYAAGLNMAFCIPALIQGRRIQRRLNAFKSLKSTR